VIERFENPLQYRACLSQDLIVPKADYSKTLGLKKACSRFVLRNCIRVLSTTQFHNQMLFGAYKVRNVWPDRVLSPESVSVQLAISQTHPKMALCVGLIFTQFVGEWV
jgi:hypothetical protein